MKYAVIALIVLVLGGGAAYLVISKNKDKKAHRRDADPNALKVALITPGEQNDGGWCQNAAKALAAIKSDLKAQTFTTVATSPNDAYDAFRKFAGEKKADVVIGHAGEWNDAKTAEIADANPHTIFLISGSAASKNNVCGVRFVLEDASYVLGQLAALMSKSNSIACVGPEQLPVIDSTFYSFEQGAKSVKPDIKVRIVWTQNSKDVNRAKEQTLMLINDGVDFIFQNANNAAQGVFEAVDANKAKGVYVFGSNDDQALTVPKYADVILASATLDVPGTYLGICRKIKEGKFEKKTQSVGIADNGVAVAFNKNLESKIPADVRKKIDETIEKLKKGELKAPRKLD